MNVVIDEEMADCSLEEVAAELPGIQRLSSYADSTEFSPRYLVYSYCQKHADGRVSYPLVFIFYCPPGMLCLCCAVIFQESSPSRT